MDHKDFKIGVKFKCDGRIWLVTDIGTRVVTAIFFNPKRSEVEGWYDGPPYAVHEMVFDEYDFPSCVVEEGEA